jgi:hypothetical protein
MTGADLALKPRHEHSIEDFDRLTAINARDVSEITGSKLAVDGGRL